MYLSIHDLSLRLVLAILLTGISICSSTAQIQETDWQDYEKRTIAEDDIFLNQTPHAFLLQQISISNFQKKLRSQAANIWLPEPDGSHSEYHIVPTKVVSDEVAHHYTINTFRGYKVSDPEVIIACDISSQGFHSTVFDGPETFYIEPYSKSDRTIHVSYYKKDIPNSKLICGAHDHAAQQIEQVSTPRKNISINEKLTFRLALVASGEYAQAFGGTPYDVTNVLNSLAAGANILNAIYLRDIGIEFILASDPDLVFPDPNTDPFDLTNQNQLLDDCQEVCATTLGVNTYDLGHLVIWDIVGGLAAFGVVCDDNRKGFGFSGFSSTFTTLWVDYVSHEIGHQFDARHNFAADECQQSVRNFRYEPGEGSSIMSYANVCGPPVQYATGSDPFFHYASIARIREFISADTDCGQVAPGANPSSPVANANSSIIIPRQTPFVLVGQGTDDNDTLGLSFSWDQFDPGGLATTGLPDCTSTVDPLFRFRPPTAAPFRSFPEYAEVLNGNNNNVDFEKLPCINRDMVFSFTVRDNNVDFGRVEHDTMVVSVVNTGPFQISSPNGGETYDGSTPVDIMWDENRTSSHCPAIDVLVSTDAGLTYEIVASNIPNTGAATIIMPNVGTSAARMLIRCTGSGGFNEFSTFYDVTDTTFTIIPATLPDEDMDGYDISVDCDDTNPDVNPGATEICNGIDDDCDGLIDAQDPSTVGLLTLYLDFDDDGFGDLLSPMRSCTPLQGFVFDNTDCNDFDPTINPGAPEICNGIDDDCDGLIDDDDPNLTNVTTWFLDNDNDGFGDDNNSITNCNPPSGYISTGGDCDDNNPNVNPAATEICNGIDDDCDGLIDSMDPSLVGIGVWFRDADGDNFGSFTNFLNACTQPIGYISISGDCDDNNANINPLAQEVCNGLDDDCDGLVDADDPSAIGVSIWFRDMDGDAFGDPNRPVSSCTQPFGFVLNNQDCNDNNSSVNPGAREICNGIDDDCDGLIDTADPDLTGTLTWYADFDGDGFGNPLAPVQACNQPAGHVANNTDCNDGNRNVNPAAQEICNGLDDDCDGLIDDSDPSLSGANILFADADMDGFGNPNNSIISCNPIVGFVNNSNDCDDTNPLISPASLEICNGLDDDCDGLIDQADPNISDLGIWYADLDGDGFGNAQNSLNACQRPVGFVSEAGDCNDGDPAVNPLSPEICNNIDDDCDGLIDSADPTLSGDSNWYEDRDNDGYGNPAVRISDCNQPTGFVSNDLDCNDNNNRINPEQVELCNGIDDDCDGLIDMADPNSMGGSTWFADNDGDGFGDINNIVIACEQPLGFTTDNTDCNDSNPLINPAGQERCNGLDDDCDGLIDAADPDNQGNGLWYQDLDNDGFGNDNVSQNTCVQPAGFVAAPGDCDDNNPDINPLETETCNGIDDNCNGLIDGNDPNLISNTIWYRDSDGDGFGSLNISTQDCSQPAGFVSNSDDCDDNNAQINPGRNEICNGIDDDCDGLVDMDDPDSANALITWYRDLDNDGFGNLADYLRSCEQPSGYVANGTDCNDEEASIFPGASEICNGRDDDCDGVTDSDDPDYAGPVDLFYRDADGDGFGDESVSIMACAQPTGFVINASDCDDNNNAVNPNRQEVCNGLDDDCDGLLDGDDPDIQGGDSTYYEDLDSDGYGNSQVSLVACTQPQGFVLEDGDCDDNDSLVNPGAQEVCNGKDDDCNGLVDMDDPDLAGVGLWFADVDMDGFGDANNTVFFCSQPAGFTFDNRDCDDNNPNINPDANEVCNDVDDNCDGLTDDQDPNLQSFTVLYEDLDNDGFGNSDRPIAACDVTTGFVDNDLDCDDLDPNVNPGVSEVLGNGIDDNCDGLVDDGTSTSEEQQLDIAIYPNPALEFINITSDEIQKVDLRIYSTQGQLLLQEINQSLPGRVNISSLSAGAYILELRDRNSDKSSVEKIIKF